jgi:hypothetical protein
MYGTLGVSLTRVLVQIITMVPLDWPVNAVSTFLSRSLRRLLHSQHEGMIIKNLSAGQNLEASRPTDPRDDRLLMTPSQVADRTWAIIREEGAVVEEALEDGDSGSSLEKLDEGIEAVISPAGADVGTSFNEKSGGLHGYQADVAEVYPGDHPTEDKDG